MAIFCKSFLLVIYPYQFKAMIISILILLPFAIAAYFIYRLVTWKMTIKVQEKFDELLIISVIMLVVFFFIDMTLSLITICHVNEQLGFNYATPELPEREIFEITEVTPGMTMDQAGLKRFDQVQMSNVNDFYRLLISKQGKEAVIPVMRNKTKIKIMVKVPELDVPLADYSLLIL